MNNNRPRLLGTSPHGVVPDAGSELVAQIVAALSAGEVVLLPTDTVYGLCCDPRNPSAVDRVYEVKGRSAEVPLAVLVSGSTDALSVADAGGFDLGRLDDVEWPGEITVVCHRRSDVALAPGVGLDARPATIGIRRPRDPLIEAVTRVVGPIAATSANRSGEPTLSDAHDIVAQLGVDLACYVDGGRRSGIPSTVVRIEAGEWSVLREGSHDHEDLARLFGPRW